MSNEVRRLKEEGVGAWNRWREENPDVEIDLSHDDFRGVNLNGVPVTG